MPPKIDGARPFIVLLTSAYRWYREYLFEAVAAHADVWLLTDTAPTWEERLIVGHTLVDVADSLAVQAAAKEVATGRPVDGVLCWDEDRMVTLAELAQALGRPGTSPDAVLRCRDKGRTRAALAAAGVPQPASVPVLSIDDATEAAEAIGFPVVIKPRALGASIGVVRVDRVDDIATAFHAAQATEENTLGDQSSEVLVEECITGPEICIDSVCINGRVTPIFLAREREGFAPHFYKIGHTLDAGDPLLADPDVLRVLRAAHAAVGYTTGITHTEMRLTSAGPKIIEINARLGGDFVPLLGWLATGIDPGLVAVETACGRYPNLTPARRSVAGIQFSFPEVGGTVEEVVVDEGALPPAVNRVLLFTTPGEYLSFPPSGDVTSRYAAVIAVAQDVAGCDAALAAGAQAITLRTR